MSSFTVKLSEAQFTARTLPQLRVFIGDISGAESAIYSQFEQPPETLIGRPADYSAMVERSRALIHLEEEEGLSNSDFAGQLDDINVINELAKCPVNELEILIHTYLATVRGTIFKLIDLDKQGEPLSFTTTTTLHEIAKQVFVVQNLLALANKANRDYPYVSLARKLPSILRLDEDAIHQISQYELYNLASIKATSADAMANKLYQHNSTGSISDELDSLSFASRMAKNLIEVRWLQETRARLKIRAIETTVRFVKGTERT